MRSRSNDGTRVAGPSRARLWRPARWVLFAAGLAGWWSVVIMPGLRSVQELPRKITDTARRAEEIGRTSRTADSDETDRRRAEQDFGDLLYTTRDAEHFEHLLRESQRLADSAGLRLLAVQPEASSVTRQFRRYPMRLTVDGAPDGLTRLLLGLTDLRPRVDVEQVALHTGEDPAHVSAEVVVSSLAWAPK